VLAPYQNPFAPEDAERLSAGREVPSVTVPSPEAPPLGPGIPPERVRSAAEALLTQLQQTEPVDNSAAD
jgi:hypothetical protein